MCGKMNSRPILTMIIAMMILIYDSKLTCHIKYIIAEVKTATEIQVSFRVSAPEASSTVDLTFSPVLLRYLARRYLAIMLAIKTMMVAGENSTSAGVMMFLIDIMMIWTPVSTIIIAIIIVAILSIF